jgi:hypothetical protein
LRPETVDADHVRVGAVFRRPPSGRFHARCRGRQTISLIEIPIEAGILLGGEHDACFVLVGAAGVEPVPS